MNIIESVYKEPENWLSTEYYFIHKSGAKVWIANGLFFCEPENGDFSIFMKYKMNKAFRWWCKNAPVEAFGSKVLD